MAGITENTLILGRDDANRSDLNRLNLDAHLKDMPTDSWWSQARQSFKALEQMIQPSWMTETLPEEHGEELEIDLHDRNMERVREGLLPWITVLPAGNHQLQLTATNEPLECIAFGTMGAKLFIDLFWEAITQAQLAGQPIVVHELQGFVPRVLLTVGSHEFELKYVQSEALVRK
jgi:hypothetical protein